MKSHHKYKIYLFQAPSRKTLCVNDLLWSSQQNITTNSLKCHKRLIYMEKDNINEDEINDLPPILNPRKSSSIAQCDICFQPYHIMGRWPMLACPNQHSFCDHCMEDMFKISLNEPVPCPICRDLIRHTKVRPNYSLFRVINKQSHVKQALKEQENQLFLYAFQHQIFEVASAFKSGKIDKIAQLAKLDCSQRRISQIQHMGAFPNLVYLRLDKNKLTFPSNLEMLQNLRYLNLSHNSIRDISPLGQLNRLSHLAVQFNQIEQICSLLPFSQLSHWFLFGNPLKGIIADEFLLVDFIHLSTLSLTCIDQDKMSQIFLKGLAICETMPKLNKIFLQNIESQQLKRSIQKQLDSKVDITWLNEKNTHNHTKWVEQFMDESQQYGQVFQFKPDPISEHIQQYQFQGNNIIKKNNIFVIINSQHCLPKEGKTNFKIQIDTVSDHMLIGVCNAFVKNNPNIYSEHFVGLTLWGYIYARGDTVNLTGQLRLKDKPVIRMSVDRQGGFIRWFSDDNQIGVVPFPQQFKHSSLYFLVGIRDCGTKLTILNE